MDEKYYINYKLIEDLPNQEISYCLDVNYHKGQSVEGFINKKRRQLIQVGNLDMKGMEQVRRVYSDEGISPTIDTIQGGHRQPKIIERTPLKFLNRNGKNVDGDYSFCIDTSQTGGIKEIYENYYKVRKLTPLECWRLMGFDDGDFKKVRDFTSDTQLYKQAGNSIVVNVLEEIIRELMKCDSI